VFSTGVKSKRLSMTIPATSTRESKLD